METGLTTQAVIREVRLREWREIIHAKQESGSAVKANLTLEKDKSSKLLKAIHYSRNKEISSRQS